MRQVQADAGSSAEAARGIARLIAGLEPRVARLEQQLREVEVPPSEREFASRYVELTEEVNNLLAAARVAAEKTDIETFQALTERANAAVAKRNRLVASHGGFERCGN